MKSAHRGVSISGNGQAGAREELGLGSKAEADLKELIAGKIS